MFNGITSCALLLLTSLTGFVISHSIPILHHKPPEWEVPLETSNVFFPNPNKQFKEIIGIELQRVPIHDDLDFEIAKHKHSATEHEKELQHKLLEKELEKEHEFLQHKHKELQHREHELLEHERKELEHRELEFQKHNFENHDGLLKPHFTPHSVLNHFSPHNILEEKHKILPHTIPHNIYEGRNLEDELHVWEDPKYDFDEEVHHHEHEIDLEEEFFPVNEGSRRRGNGRDENSRRGNSNTGRREGSNNRGNSNRREGSNRNQGGNRGSNSNRNEGNNRGGGGNSNRRQNTNRNNNREGGQRNPNINVEELFPRRDRQNNNNGNGNNRRNNANNSNNGNRRRQNSGENSRRNSNLDELSALEEEVFGDPDFVEKLSRPERQTSFFNSNNFDKSTYSEASDEKFSTSPSGSQVKQHLNSQPEDSSNNARNRYLVHEEPVNSNFDRKPTGIKAGATLNNASKKQSTGNILINKQEYLVLDNLTSSSSNKGTERPTKFNQYENYRPNQFGSNTNSGFSTSQNSGVTNKPSRRPTSSFGVNKENSNQQNSGRFNRENNYSHNRPANSNYQSPSTINNNGGSALGHSLHSYFEDQEGLRSQSQNSNYQSEEHSRPPFSSHSNTNEQSSISSFGNHQNLNVQQNSNSGFANSGSLIPEGTLGSYLNGQDSLRPKRPSHFNNRQLVFPNLRSSITSDNDQGASLIPQASTNNQNVLNFNKEILSNKNENSEVRNLPVLEEEVHSTSDYNVNAESEHQRLFRQTSDSQVFEGLVSRKNDHQEPNKHAKRKGHHPGLGNNKHQPPHVSGSDVFQEENFNENLQNEGASNVPDSLPLYHNTHHKNPNSQKGPKRPGPPHGNNSKKPESALHPDDMWVWPNESEKQSKPIKSPLDQSENQKGTAYTATTKNPIELPKNEFSQHPNIKLLPVDSCGIDLGNKIIGGTSAQLDEFPWMALLQHTSESGNPLGFGCGGSLISHRYVLTAAHCIKGPGIKNNVKVTRVRLGEFDTSSETDCQGEVCNQPPVDVPVEKIIVHPEYKATDRAQLNDIALIRLREEVKNNAYISPICLPLGGTPQNITGERFTTAGWGKIENGQGAKSSKTKQKVSLPGVNLEDCAKYYNQLNIELKETQMCAGGEKGKDSCRGDSGGPLMKSHAVDSQIKWQLHGVVSFGPETCGKDNVAGVYTKVFEYLKWILDNMEK